MHSNSTPGFVQGAGIVPEGTGNIVNISAKISGSGLGPAGTGRVPTSVNAPMGEAYEAYWNWWLREYARQIGLRFPDLSRSGHEPAGGSCDPMATIERLYRLRGCDAVFGLARAMGSPSGFDVVSLVLTSALSVQDLVRRWSGLLSLQASLRYQERNAGHGFVMSEKDSSLVLSPHKVRPANRKPFGPAMLAGVVTGTLESAGLSLRGIWSVPRGGAAKPVFRFGTFLGETMEFDSDIVLMLSGGANALKRTPGFPPSLGFRHLLDPGVGPVQLRLVKRLVDTLEQSEGDHAALPDTAARLGLSSRSLSRRLAETGIGYGRLARFVRLRKASRLLLAGETSLEDIAYRAAYSDRHHMSRDFRSMAQITPSGLRDLLAR